MNNYIRAEKIEYFPTKKNPVERLLTDSFSAQKDEYVVAGGFIRDFISGKDYSDIDIFILNAPRASESNAGGFVNSFSSLSAKEFFQNTFISKIGRLVFDSERIKTYQVPGAGKVQVIISEEKTVEELLKEFDFSICQFGWDLGSDELVLDPISLLDLKNGRLRFNQEVSGKFIANSFERLQKYGAQGFKACSGTVKGMIDKVRSVDEQTIKDNFSYYMNGNKRTILFD